VASKIISNFAVKKHRDMKNNKHSNVRKTTEQFIEEARQVHGDKYDYSKVEYVNSATKVCIVCPEHGEFWQRAGEHLKGKGCIKCAKHYKPTTEEFIEKARKAHGDKYDYSKVEYVNNKTKVCIICPEHGEFWQKPNNHLSGQGCPFCAGNAKLKNRKAKTHILERLNGTDFKLVKFDYKGSRNCDIVIKCKKCGTVKKYKTFSYIKTTCSTCEIKTHILERLDGTNLELIDFDYKTVRDCKITTKCKGCGRIKKFNQLFNLDIRKCWTCEYNKYKQRAFEKISKCKTLNEFRKNYRKEYCWVKSNKLLEEMTSHLKRGHGKIERLIYVYEIYVEGMKPHAYIGLTYNLEMRDKQHLQGGKRDSLWKFCKEHNIPMPKPKILMDYVPEDKASRMEVFYEQQYRERGFETINVAKCGGLGAGKSHTFEEIKTIGKKYSSRKEWESNDKGSYIYASKHYKKVNGKNVRWIDLIIPQNKTGKKPVIAMNIKTKETRLYEKISDTEKDGFRRECVRDICHGRYGYHNHKGWSFRFIKDVDIENIEREIIDRRKPIIAYNPKTKETRLYEKISDTRKDGFSDSCVSRVCNDKRKSHKGWTFRYLKDGEIENVA